MTLRKIAIRMSAAIALTAFAACNSSTYQNVEQTASAAVITSFSLAKNDKVLEGLDSVFFSIDLQNGLIFNADSLPKGTRVTGLVPSISTLEGASLIEMTVTRAGKADTVISYTGNASDSVDFTNPVRVRVVSPDGLNEKTYEVRVNVHTQLADSLAWHTEASFALPTSLAAPVAQYSARAGSNLYILTADAAGSYCMARYSGVDNLGYGFLNDTPCAKSAPAFGFTPRVETLHGTTDGSLYILGTDGTLYRSTDGGASWTATPREWVAVIGAYGSDLLGIASAGASFYTQNLAGDNFEMPAGMPVEGFSAPVEYTFPMSSNPQLMIVGGRRADGTLTTDTWGFDGSRWACLSRRGLPAALEGAILVPYVAFRQAGSLSYTEVQAMLVFGGRDADGLLSSTTYISTDYGVNWRQADATMQLPDYMPAMWNAQAVVLNTEMRANIAAAPARISRPVESWACPYIYIIGGCDASGALYPTIWRGAINKLTYKPIV